MMPSARSGVVLQTSAMTEPLSALAVPFGSLRRCSASVRRDGAFALAVLYSSIPVSRSMTVSQAALKVSGVATIVRLCFLVRVTPV